MVMTIPAGGLRSAPRLALFDRLGLVWHAWLERRAHRLALRRAGRLGPRLLADMGLDAATAAARDEWGALLPNGYLVQRRG